MQSRHTEAEPLYKQALAISPAAGAFADAIAVAQVTGQPADINSVRVYRSRPGVSINLEQQVSQYVGVFARAGWADGNVEPWDFTDIDGTVSGGFSLSGKQWGRPYDTIEYWRVSGPNRPSPPSVETSH